MKKRVLAFGASTSRSSINKQFATYAAGRLDEFETTIIDLNDYPMPLFSVDLEKSHGAPETAFLLKALIAKHDGLIISFAEHNGAYSAAFKNALDWISRLDGKAWAGKPALLLSTSPGTRGGATVLEIAKNRFPFNGGEVAASFSLPQFRINLDPQSGIKDPELAKQFEEALQAFRARLKE
jgi:NAD(P)H-dependent FMN reductase